jgi:hypothetical protein
MGEVYFDVIPEKVMLRKRGSIARSVVNHYKATGISNGLFVNLGETSLKYKSLIL